MRKKIGVFWVNPYSDNKGVAALSYSVVYLLEEIARKKNIKFEYYLIGNYKKKKRNDFIVINNRKVYYYNVKIIVPKGVKGILKTIFYYKDRVAVSKIDYALDIGEGDSYSDIYGSERFWKLNRSKIDVLRKKKKLALLPQTIGPFKEKILEEEAKKVIRMCDMIMVRDKKSYKYVVDDLCRNDVCEFIDVAFYLPWNKKEKKIEKNRKINIGINISGLLWNGGYTCDNQFNLKVDYKNFICEVIEFFASSELMEVHLIGHVFSSGFLVEDDYNAICSVSEKYKENKIVIAPKFDNPVDAKSYISEMDFFIGSRMHACIAAFSSIVPVYPLAYSRKFDGLFVDTLGYSYCGNMQYCDKDKLMSELIAAFSERVKLRKDIDDIMSNYVYRAKQNMEKVIGQFLDLE